MWDGDGQSTNHWVQKWFWKFINKRNHRPPQKKLTLPHCPGSMLSYPCSMLMSHGHIWKIYTHSDVQWHSWLLSPEIVLKIVQQKTHKLPQKNNWHPQSKWQWEQKNWHKTTRKKLPHCRGFMLPSQCSMLIRVPMVNQKSALTAICNGKGWLLSPELVLKIDLQKYWQTITIK